MSGNRKPVTCPYCYKPAEFMASSTPVYGRDYGPLHICKPCDAYVGCHKGTTIPLGRLANAPLRRMKARLHDLFDPIWKGKVEAAIQEHGFPPKGIKQRERVDAYRRLSSRLGIRMEECHIGMFDEETCQRAIALLSSGDI